MEKEKNNGESNECIINFSRFVNHAGTHDGNDRRTIYWSASLPETFYDYRTSN